MKTSETIFESILRNILSDGVKGKSMILDDADASVWAIIEQCKADNLTPKETAIKLLS